MTSILKVNNIQSSASNAAITISSSGVISQPTLPIFNVTKTADQSGIVDATATLVTFDSITDGSNGGRTINQGGLWASNKLTVTADTAGYYWVYTNLFWESTQAVGGENYGYWRKNGSIIQTYVYSNSLNTAQTSGCLQVNQIVDLTTTGDYLELFIYFDNSSSGTTNLNQNSLEAQRTTAGGWKVG